MKLKLTTNKQPHNCKKLVIFCVKTCTNKYPVSMILWKNLHMQQTVAHPGCFSPLPLTKKKQSLGVQGSSIQF